MPDQPEKPTRGEFYQIGKRECLLVGRLLLLMVFCILICFICFVIFGLLKPSVGRYVPERNVKEGFIVAFVGIALACAIHVLMPRPSFQMTDKPTRRRWLRWTIVALLVLYVLSVV